MTTMTLRDRVEAAVKAAGDYEADFIDRGAEMSADERVRFLELAVEAGNLATQLETEAKATGTLEGAQDSLRRLGLTPSADQVGSLAQQDAAASRASGVIQPLPGTTLGDMFAQSDAYGELRERHAPNGSEPFSHFEGRSKSLNLDFSMLSAASNAQRLGQVTNLVTTTDVGDNANGGGFVRPTYLPGFVDADPLAQPYLWDLCTVVPVSGEGWKYARLVSRTNNAAFVAETTDTADEAAIDQTPANGYKPGSDLEWDQATGTVETVAHWIPMTTQAAADAPQMVAIVNAFLVQGLRVAIEASMLQGNGTSPNLRGFLNATNPYTNLISVSVGAGDRFNAILTAMGQVRTAGRGLFQPNAIVVNSADYYSPTFLGAQDGNDNWKFGGPMSPMANGLLPIWGLRVILTDQIVAGTQLLGDFRWAQIGDRQDASLFMTASHKDWAERNLLFVRAEQRMGFVLQAEDAFAQVVA